MATGELGIIDGQQKMEAIEGLWRLDEDDWLLLAMLCDPIFCAELLFEDPLNREYGSCYRVMDYQYPLFRPTSCYQAFPCARSVGKTESIKARAIAHVFKRRGEDLLLTAPELIHLEALTQHVEHRATEVRLVRDFLKSSQQKSGITHKPFMMEFGDGTRIIGRIPKLSGTGVKGMHEPDLMIDEAQDYPPKGWTEVHEAQPIDAPVLTPDGYVPIGDLRTGDFVVGSNGKRTRVVNVIDRGRRPIFAVRFSDGSTVETDADHLWTVMVNGRETKPQVRRTREIMEDLERLGGYGSSRRPWFVPEVRPVSFRRRRLPVDPYAMGALIGDGCFRKGSLEFSTADEDILMRLEMAALHDDEWVKCGKFDYRLRKKGTRSRHGRPALRIRIEESGLWGLRSHEKFIPSPYLHAGIVERFNLLLGLMDTDGNIDSRGAARFVTTSPRLATDVCFLVRSLGGRLVCSRREDRRGFRDVYTVRFRIRGACPTTLPRKRAKWQDVGGESVRRKIVAVEPVDVRPVRCIEVAATDGLYVADEFILTHNTVMKDHVDSTGKYDFTYHFYGVHSGAAGGRFERLAESGEFQVTAITALMRPGWGKSEKAAASAMYGGTHSPDYRRNILGEPGTALSQFFVTSRLMACLDQDSESHYNTVEFHEQHLTAEDVDKMLGPSGDIGPLLDLHEAEGPIYGGMDVGLINDPTVITIFEQGKDKDRKDRLKLRRMIYLWRFRERQIREVCYRIDQRFGKKLQMFGQDITGLGLPLFQAMEDDEICPDHLKRVSRGYVFNAKVPVAVDEDYVSRQGDKLFDQYGNMVKKERDPWTGQDRYVSEMSMIEASTRYLRLMVDSTYLLLPFHQGLVKDMQGETEQRVRAMGASQSRKKPSAFHILDSKRAMAMAYKAAEIESTVLAPDHQPILDKAVNVTPGVGGGIHIEALA